MSKRSTSFRRAVQALCLTHIVIAGSAYADTSPTTRPVTLVDQGTVNPGSPMSAAILVNISNDTAFDAAVASLYDVSSRTFITGCQMPKSLRAHPRRKIFRHSSPHCERKDLQSPRPMIPACYASRVPPRNFKQRSVRKCTVMAPPAAKRFSGCLPRRAIKVLMRNSLRQ